MNATSERRKVAIVTGAATGIGRAIAEQYARRGDAVVIADLNGPLGGHAAAELSQIGRCLAIQTDVSDEPSVIEMVRRTRAELGGLDYLVNNAGIHLHKLIVDTELAEWNRQLAVQLTGPFLCAREAARDMLRHDTRGAIVNIVSVAARMGRVKGAAHSASKAGLIMLTQTLAMELGGRGIRVNAIAPGLIDTESQRAEEVISTAYKQAYIKEIPLGRLGEPGEIADAVMFLCSDAARWITGHTLFVDGGFMAGNLSLQGNVDYFAEMPLQDRERT
jgi:NAD(P)-dependent dehydrogenase (short-subunit alcohol dehydrogenase family)